MVERSETLVTIPACPLPLWKVTECQGVTPVTFIPPGREVGEHNPPARAPLRSTRDNAPPSHSGRIRSYADGKSAVGQTANRQSTKRHHRSSCSREMSGTPRVGCACGFAVSAVDSRARRSVIQSQASLNCSNIDSVRACTDHRSVCQRSRPAAGSIASVSRPACPDATSRLSHRAASGA